jgi:hypothetical protein
MLINCTLIFSPFSPYGNKKEQLFWFFLNPTILETLEQAISKSPAFLKNKSTSESNGVSVNNLLNSPPAIHGQTHP